MIGEIFKLKNSTISTQTFIMLVSMDGSYVILFDNINNNIVGDLTKGLYINDYVLSSISEMSEFIVNNNY